MDSAMTPITLDVEASGFGTGSYPIEIGIVLPEGSRHCYLIAPARSWKEWDPDAEAVHGITRECIETYGRPVHDVAWRLNAMLRNKVVYSDAWSYDMTWVARLYDSAGMLQTFRIADISELITEVQHGQWQNAKQRVIDDLGLQRHRASGDARILQETWLRVNRAVEGVAGSV